MKRNHEGWCDGVLRGVPVTRLVFAPCLETRFLVYAEAPFVSMFRGFSTSGLPSLIIAWHQLHIAYRVVWGAQPRD